MNIKKQSGELVPFNPNALKNSLSKSGATPSQVSQVYEKIEQELFEGITSRALYEKAFAYLRKIKKAYAAKYSLKKALRDLGPTGFYFEKWVCSLMHHLGYQTINGQTLQGHAVTHEIDVIAINNDEFNIAECKLRNDIDAKISVTIPMYFLSRMKDLANLEFNYFGAKRYITKGWLITNAYFTIDSIKFGSFYGINLLSWDYPNGNSIKNLTDNGNLYPITCMTEITDAQKISLLDNNIILVQDIIDHPDKVSEIIRNKTTVEELLFEAKELLDLK